MRTLCIALLLCIALISPIAAVDLSGVWTVVIPSEQAMGTAIITGDTGEATITSNKLLIPVTISDRFNIRPAGENRFLIACTYGEYAVRYMTEEDYKASLQPGTIESPYAYRTIVPGTAPEEKNIIIDEV